MPSTSSKRNVVVLIVFIALLLDNLLLTSIVPILPNYLREKRSSSRPDFDGPKLITSTSWPATSVNIHHMPKKSQSYSWSQIGHANNTHNSTDMEKENTAIGLLIGVKTFAQLLSNFIVGPLTNRIGYTVPMFSGFIVLFISTMLFAFADTYILLFVARTIQGVGTALSTTSGMGLLASLFPDQKQRGLALTIAFSGLAAGVLIGPPYGGVLYDWTGGKEVPFFILAGITLLEGVLQLIVIRPRYSPEERKGSSYLKLLSDPFILVTAASITISSLTVAVLEPVLPIWMYHTMGSPAWLQGVAFVPSTLSYLLCMQIFATITHRMKCCDPSHSWISAFIGTLLLGGSITVVPFCRNVYHLIAPLTVNGIGLALVSSSMLPHVGYLVDHRHEPAYGVAYALTDNAFCVAFALGPGISGPMVDSIGFTWTLLTIGSLSVLTAPMVCLLRIAHTRKPEETQTESTRLVPKTVAFSSSAKDYVE